MRKINIIILSAAILSSACLLVGCGEDNADFILEQAPAGGIGIETGQGETESGIGKADRIWVHICGAVEQPGVYELDAGSRVCDALLAAGGFCADAATDSVNLAEALKDGMQVVIPTIAQQEARNQTAEEQEQGLVNINTAAAEQLCTLSGIGQSRAESIIAYRENCGGFRTIEEIMQVTGIKEGMYAKFKDKITIGK